MDRELLLAGRAATVAANRANAARWTALLAFFARRLAGQKTRKAQNPLAPLTARQETVVEVGELWGMSSGALRRELNAAIFLHQRMPKVMGLVSSGSLDNYRARMIADGIRAQINQDREPDEKLAATLAAVDTRVSRFLLKHLRTLEDEGDAGAGLICCTRRQLQNKLAYEVRKLRAADEEQRFAQRYRNRHASVQTGEDGIGWLTIEHAVDRVQLAHHRLTLAARELRANGDTRTLDQLRSDLALDLLIGANSDGEQASVPVPGFARPIINVTVPIQTLMGIADHPAELSGGTVIPASLARVIAARPGATWYRMLTDPHGHISELSTKAYQPTAPIWRHVVADQTTCYRPGCDRPATECELDHRTPWPQGATTTSNLWPACKSDHQTKHTVGFSIGMLKDGQFGLATPTGFVYPITKAEHPDAYEWPELPDEADFQFTPAEFLHTLAHLRISRALKPDHTGLWEDGPRPFHQFADLTAVEAVHEAA